MKKNFEILGLSEGATKLEVDKAYEKLKTKYSRDRFLEGDAGNRAAKNLTNVENAYQELCEYFREKTIDSQDASVNFLDVENEIKLGNYDEAQKILDRIIDRNSEWHYLQSVIFYKKNWLNESKKQLEIALSLEPNNAKYNDAYAKLRQKVETNSNKFNNGNNYYASNNNQNMNNRQMGGTDMGGCVDCCATWCCLELLCGGCR